MCVWLRIVHQAQVFHAGIAVAGLIAICLCVTVTILELMKLKREAKLEEAQKEEAAKVGPIHNSQVRELPVSRLYPAQ